MRSFSRWLVAAFATAALTGGSTVACFNAAADCTWTNSCPLTASSGSAGGGRETRGECIPSEHDEPVDDACGVFVSSSFGDDSGGGAKEVPAKTLAAAIERIRNENAPGRIYACAEEFAEAVELPAGVSLYGGLDCKRGWAWSSDTKTTIAAGSDQVALAVRGAEGTTHVEDVLVKAADAQTAGASSIAMLVEGATVELARSELVAGNGADGAPGAPGAEPPAPGDPVPPAQAGAAGNGGVNACSDLDGAPGPDAMLLGGVAVENACGGESSVGGKGGDGGLASGFDGEAGPGGSLGQPGLGEPEAGSGWACVFGAGLANAGGPGGDGRPGDGAVGLGTLSVTEGYVGVSGGEGTPGKPGQGGGGGGGAKGLVNCGGGQPGAGASGGSGGAGGCGGKPGQGGGAGGASIAFVSVDAAVTLTDCRLQAGQGGKGGRGGDLQPGGSGGNGGTGGTGVSGSQDACNGGKGGKGGNGGPGGGGLGGPSFAIAFRGTPLAQVGRVELTPGTPGEGGPGGNDEVAQNAGAIGAAAPEQELK